MGGADREAVGRDGGPTRGRHALAGAVAVAGATAFTQPSVAGSDLWWHLASGREILQQGAPLRVDPFSYSFAGEPWTNHEWLWDVLYWSAYRLHPELAAWLNLAVLVATFALIFAIARRTSGSALAAGAALWAAAATAHWFFDIRPHLFTLLLASLVLITRDRAWGVWLWPPLMLVWVNLHAGFAFGLGVMGLIALARTADASVTAGRPSLPWQPWTALALAAGIIVLNPYGLQVVEYPLAYLDASSPFRSLIEWRPPPLLAGPAWLDLPSYAMRFWGMVGLVALGTPLAGGRARGPAAVALLGLPILSASAGTLGYAWPGIALAPAALLLAAPGRRLLPALALVTLSMATTSRRFIPLFCLTGAPLAAAAVAWGLAVARERVPALRGTRAAAAATAAAALAALLLWSGVRLYPELLYRWTESSFYPEAALRYLRAAGPPERLLNLYNWGGYIALHAPEVRVFIDGRANTLYDDEIYLEYVRVSSAAKGYRSILERRRFDAVLFPTASSLVQALRADPRSWRPIYSDRLATLLVRSDAPYLLRDLPLPADVVGDHPDFDVVRARTLALNGDPWTAAERMEAMVAAHPLNVPVWGDLARAYAWQGEADAIEKTIDRAIAKNPRAASRLHEFEGYSYEIAGDLERAIEALRLATPRGPFRGASGMRRYIANLKQRRQGGTSSGGGP